MTTRSVEARVAELSRSTSLPEPFKIEAIYSADDAQKSERQIHKSLLHFRTNPNREFFKCELKIAKSAAEKFCLESLEISKIAEAIRSKENAARMQAEAALKKAVEKEWKEREKQLLTEGNLRCVQEDAKEKWKLLADETAKDAQESLEISKIVDAIRCKENAAQDEQREMVKNHAEIRHHEELAAQKNFVEIRKSQSDAKLYLQTLDANIAKEIKMAQRASARNRHASYERGVLGCSSRSGCSVYLVAILFWIFVGFNLNLLPFQQAEPRIERSKPAYSERRRTKDEPVSNLEEKPRITNNESKRKVIKTYKNGMLNNASFVLTEWYDSSQIKSKATYEDNKLNGLTTTWHKNGQIWKLEMFADGELNGLATEWYENSQKMGEFNWKNGELNGANTSWYANGQIKRKATRKDGKLNGLVSNWYENGLKQSERTWKNGVPVGKTKYWDRLGQEK